MSGTYLVCDVCGNYGPPASFIGKDGLRLCYQCAYQEDLRQADAKPEQQQHEHRKTRESDARDE